MPYTLSEDATGRMVALESGGDPNAQTGTYKGLLQLSPEEAAKYGGYGLDSGKASIEAKASELERILGRPITDLEAYLAHQQGAGGAAAHLNNPDQPAWKSMADTAEGRKKGEAWAKQAIWGNLTPEMKARYGNVDNVTSGDFTNEWGARYAGISPSQAPARVPTSPPIGAPEPPKTAVAQAQPMGSLPAFSFTPSVSAGTAPTIAPTPTPASSPLPAAPPPLLNISQYHPLAPLIWSQLLRG